MWCKFNTNLCIFITIIVLATTRNLVRAQTPATEPAPIIPDSQNIINIRSPRHFHDVVLESKDTVITQFHAPWCDPCKKLGPVVAKKVEEQNGKIKLARVDLANEDLEICAKEQGIRTIPTLTSYKNGEIVDEMVGFKSQKSVLRYVDKQVEDNKKN